MTIQFSNTYAQLPDRLFARVSPFAFPAPSIVRFNNALAADLGLDHKQLDSPEGAAILAGAKTPDGAEPLAMAYAGHQFGNWVPQLGDGRAMLLGEVVTPAGARFDIHLKGSGRTPFSRGGDGKAVLSAVLREYIISEAMHALGIPTTRSLAAVATGEQVMREGLEPGAVLARVAASHIRVGTFQYLYARKDAEGLQALMDHVIARHYPECASAETPALALLAAVMARQAELVARWMQVGFIHGVMNTDNVSIAGETIDYGPCAFMDTYHPSTVFSSIDRQGRYAWGNQPKIAHWNLAQFAQSLLPLIAAEPERAAVMAQEVLDAFGEMFEAAYFRVFQAKLGLTGTTEADRALVTDLLHLMAEDTVDFTRAFRELARGLAGDDFSGVKSLFASESLFEDWLARWLSRLGNERAIAATTMLANNPAFIPRNHRVEEALTAANQGDFAPFETLLKVLSTPFEDQPNATQFEAPPRPEEIVHATFCGT